MEFKFSANQQYQLDARSAASWTSLAGRASGISGVEIEGQAQGSLSLTDKGLANQPALSP